VSWLLQELCVPVSKTAGSCVTGLLYDNNTNVLLLRNASSQYMFVMPCSCIYPHILFAGEYEPCA
jgi:hypothetical protein